MNANKVNKDSELIELFLSPLPMKYSQKNVLVKKKGASAKLVKNIFCS